MNPKTPRHKSARAERIEEVLTHATGAAEQCLAWHTHLRSIVRFPFVAKFDVRAGVKPFTGGAMVQVIGLAGLETDPTQILAKVMDGQRSIAIPLEQLSPRINDEVQLQAISDWRHWLASRRPQ